MDNKLLVMDNKLLELIHKLYSEYKIHEMKKKELFGLMYSIIFATTTTVDPVPLLSKEEIKAIINANILGQQNYKFVELLLIILNGAQPTEASNILAGVTKAEDKYEILVEHKLGYYINLSEDKTKIEASKIGQTIIDEFQLTIVQFLDKLTLYANKMTDVRNVAKEIEVYDSFNVFSFETYINLEQL